MRTIYLSPPYKSTCACTLVKTVHPWCWHHVLKEMRDVSPALYLDNTGRYIRLTNIMTRQALTWFHRWGELMPVETVIDLFEAKYHDIFPDYRVRICKYKNSLNYYIHIRSLAEPIPKMYRGYPVGYL